MHSFMIHVTVYHARVVASWGRKSVLFREVSSFQECPHRERARFHCNSIALYIVLAKSMNFSLEGATITEELQSAGDNVADTESSSLEIHRSLAWTLRC